MKKTVFLAFLTVLLCVAALPDGVQAEDKASERHAAVRLVPERNMIRPGETLAVGIEQVLDHGWHTYWINPGDSGEAMRVTWHLPQGFTTGDLSWPVPEKIATGPLVSYGYEGRSVLLASVTAPDPLPAGPLVLKAEVELLVCADVCIPEFGTYELFLNSEPPKDNGDFIKEAKAALPQELDGRVTFREDNGDFVLEHAGSGGLAAGTALTVIPEDWGVVENTADSVSTVTDDRITVRQKRGDRPLRALTRVRGLFSYKDEAGNRHAYSFSAMPAEAAATDNAAASQSPMPAPAGVSVLKAIVLALLGGLVLNLMPCVFPILSLKALKLCKISGRELGFARLQSLFYMAGILACFGIFAAFLLVLRGAGEQIGWGFQLQNPLFVVSLGWLLFLVGLNLAGFFEFSGRLANVGHKFADGHDYAASFFTGMLAALVATPCTAPFMGVAVGFALTQTAAVTLVVFAALGFGLALPYMVLAFMPALHRYLPRPGAWMETFRQFLSFPLFASAAWLAWVYSQQGGPLSIMVALSGAISFVFALWLMKKTAVHHRAARAVLKIIAVGFLLAPPLALVFMAQHHDKEDAAAAAAADMPDGWIAYDPADFARREAGNDPLFVDMTAAWCITCKVNEKVALGMQSVRDLFASRGVQPVKGDWTNYNDDITSYLASFGRSGVPLYVYYGPRDPESGKRPDPVVLPQILTPGIIRDIIGKDTVEDQTKEQ